MNAQQLILNHLLPIAAAIAVLWLVYRLLFVNSNRLKFNRFFLIAAMLFSMALPLIGPLMGSSSPQIAALKENLFKGTLLDEITITPEGQQPMTAPEIVVETASRPHLSLWQVLGGLYLIGVGVMTLLFLVKLGKLVVMIARSPKEKREGYTAVFTGREQGSFSFLRYAFFPNENVSPDIVRHERSHIAHHHSADILFVELMMILQWFNPFIYRYKKELQSLHEYQADRDVVATGVDKRNYMMLILQQCTAADFSGMSNNFSLILTKKRIKMITRNEKAKGLWWRLLATLPVLAILMIANTRVTAQEMDAEMEENKSITVIQSETDGETTSYNITSSGDLHVKPTQPDNDSIYQIVDQMPEYPGGVEAMMKYVAENVKYPEKAKDEEISGRVFISFVIEKDGSVSNVELKRGIGGGCDDEAVRVVKAMPKWKPGIKDGKPVRVSYMMPINFKLTDDTPTKSVKKTEANKPDMKPNADGVYQIVEEMPCFPGGDQKLMEYIANNINYPQEARDKGIEGRVFIGMVIEKDGSVSKVKILRGIGGGCDEEAERVISSMPKWMPGKVGGEPVPVSYMLPVNFKLQEKQSKKK
jgi:TonB family protein